MALVSRKRPRIGLVVGDAAGIVYLYHDQGNIGMKAAAFGEATLIYAGLPVCVTSPGHGTAYDIAGQRRADHGNLRAALEVRKRGFANPSRAW